MGVVGSKSPLERRNTVLRRSQRKSIHGIKSKSGKLFKDIKKFKGVEEDSQYQEIKTKIETAERDLKSHVKTLQPQVRFIYEDTLKKIQELYNQLEAKLKENQEKKEEEDKDKEKEPEEDKEEAEDEDVEVDEVFEEPEHKNVEVKVIQVEPIETSPQLNKRLSVMKMGVPVLPGSIIESIYLKNEASEQKISKIRKDIEDIEVAISQFVGHKNGRFYNNIKDQLFSYLDELGTISSQDEDILEQIKLCKNYIGSCLNFLDEKAVANGDGDDDDYDDVEGTEEPKKEEEVVPNLSPRTIKTTYI